MTIRGKEYDVDGAKRRAVYTVIGAAPTPEQQLMIDRLEKGFHGDWGSCLDPYAVMRSAGYIGIELDEEVLGSDGRWYRVDNPDVELMRGGAM